MGSLVGADVVGLADTTGLADAEAIALAVGDDVAGGAVLGPPAGLALATGEGLVLGPVDGVVLASGAAPPNPGLGESEPPEQPAISVIEIAATTEREMRSATKNLRKNVLLAA